MLRSLERVAALIPVVIQHVHVILVHLVAAVEFDADRSDLPLVPNVHLPPQHGDAMAHDGDRDRRVGKRGAAGGAWRASRSGGGRLHRPHREASA